MTAAIQPLHARYPARSAAAIGVRHCRRATRRKLQQVGDPIADLR